MFAANMVAPSLVSSLTVALLSLAALGCATAPAPHARPTPTSAYVYVGGYRPEISIFKLDLHSGSLQHLTDVPAGTAPSFLAFDPALTHLYALDEVDSGRVRAFAIDGATGGLRSLNEVSSAGVGPAHLSVDRSGHFVLVANYADKKSGTIAVLPIDADGKLGDAVDTKDFGPATMPHMIVADPSNHYVYVPCKGGPYVAEFSFDGTTGRLSALDPEKIALPPGAGPRHLAFHPGKDVAYLINEQAMTVVVYALDHGSGKLTEQQTIGTLPAGASATDKGLSTAEIEVHPSGKFLYGSNRGHNSIVIYRIDDAGRLSLVGHESRTIAKPRHFQIDPTGTLLLVANQDGGTISVFRIDLTTGRLELLGAPTPAGKQPSFVGTIIPR
jgi:6-phosphogluconolactonase